MKEINDIKPLVEVPDYSFYIFIVLILFGLTLIFIFAYVIYRLFKKNISIEKQYYEELKNLDFQDSKNSAYLITKYIRVLAKSKSEINQSNEIISLLQEYKYKKNVKDMDNNIKAKLEIFLESVNV